MSKKLGIITIHGMGDTPEDYDSEIKKDLKRRVGDTRWSQVAWGKVYYQSILQRNQARLMRDIRQKADVDWTKLRKFLLYGFSDAAAMETRLQDAPVPIMSVAAFLLVVT